MKIRLKNQPIFHRLSVSAAIISAILAAVLLAAVFYRGIRTAQQPVEAPTLTAAVPEGDVVLIDINTADAEQLQLLPGIGPKLAQAIIETRDENGPFLSADDLLSVKGIGRATCDDITPYITFSSLQSK